MLEIIAVGATASAGCAALYLFRRMRNMYGEKKQMETLRAIEFSPGEEEAIRETCRAMAEGVKTKRRRRGPAIDYGMCFSGEDAVNWLVQSKKVPCVLEANQLCLKMIALGLVGSIGKRSGFYCSKHKYYVFAPEVRMKPPTLPPYTGPNHIEEIPMGCEPPTYDTCVGDVRWVDLNSRSSSPPEYHELSRL
eukprot:comp21737_c1_seq1/m.30757 comp21737_c1_seq1/g.30757  ORF comp21737_c1_seq1/g.30757 comp21737_c1_seq1/m.30757 type:complete len:192 (-) comp21737_c1_seq1:183-758(-)